MLPLLCLWPESSRRCLFVSGGGGGEVSVEDLHFLTKASVFSGNDDEDEDDDIDV